MEVGTDGTIAARRCLQAMSETQDIETRFSLWRAASKYAAKARKEGGQGFDRLELTEALPFARLGGGTSELVWGE